MKKKGILIVLSGLFLADVLAGIAVYDLSQRKFLEVDFFDVGQGDSIFIETRQGHQILIDGGPTSAILEKLGKEMPFWDRTIDLVISTHPDSDHLSGLIDVLKNYKVDYVAYTGILSKAPEFQEFKKQVAKNKVQLIVIKRGERITIREDIYFDVFAPVEDFEGREVADFNSSSVVVKLVFKNRSFLFTGDSPKSVEEKLAITDGGILDSDILKVSHHGSKTGTSDKFLQVVSPEIAVIQVGKDNNYGHPAKEVLDRLAKYGINTLRTDINGDIKIVSDGSDFKIKK